MVRMISPSLPLAVMFFVVIEFDARWKGTTPRGVDTGIEMRKPKIQLQLGISGSTLLVVGDLGSHVVQAGKNLSSVTVLRPEDLNVYDIVRCNSIVIPQRELERVREVWS